jgi:LAGLIDADG endonuclease
LATVITNLLSAVPFFGQDLVELINVSNLNINLFIIENWNYTSFLQTEVASMILPTIGIVSPHALKKGNKIRLDKKEYLSIPFQFLAFLVGLIDGDGYIQITRTTKGYIAIKLVICLELADLSTLEYIHSVLKLGKITIYKDIRNPICKLIINRTDLQEVFFPLLIHHNIFFLIHNRIMQFRLAMAILDSGIKLYDEVSLLKENLVNKESKVNYLSLTTLEYLNLIFFKNWLVGFTNSEGSFFIKNNKDGCFQLKQSIHFNLFEALKLLFDSKTSIYIENDRFLQLTLSSKKDIQSVINFFSFSGLHPLVGLKGIQYLKWLNTLKISNRYKNLKFPQ